VKNLTSFAVLIGVGLSATSVGALIGDPLLQGKSGLIQAFIRGAVEGAPFRQAWTHAGRPTLEEIAGQHEEATAKRISKTYGVLPLAFEVNQGQTKEDVKFLARGGSHNLFLTSTEAVLALKRRISDSSHTKSLSAFEIKSASGRFESAGTSESTVAVVRIQLKGSNPSAQLIGLDELPGKAHYMFGNDPKKWRTNIPTYHKVLYTGVYPPGLTRVQQDTSPR